MSDKKEHPWRFTIGAWGAFIIVAILFLLFDYNGYAVLGLLTAAIIVTIGNIIYLLYKKSKKQNRKRGN